MIKNGLLILCFLFSAPKLFAKSYMKIGTIYMSETNGGSTTSRHWLDVGGGYLTSQGFSFGILYSTEKTSFAGGGVNDRTSFGPNIGWVSKKDNGFFGLATYLVSSTLTNGYKGSGYQFDIGYKFALERVAFAPQLSFKKYNYDSQNGQSSDYSEGRIDPYFVVWVDF